MILAFKTLKSDELPNVSEYSSASICSQVVDIVDYVIFALSLLAERLSSHSFRWAQSQHIARSSEVHAETRNSARLIVAAQTSLQNTFASFNSSREKMRLATLVSSGLTPLFQDNFSAKASQYWEAMIIYMRHPEIKRSDPQEANASINLSDLSTSQTKPVPQHQPYIAALHSN